MIDVFVGTSFISMHDDIRCNEAVSSYIGITGISMDDGGKLELLTVVSLLRGRLFNQTLL